MPKFIKLNQQGSIHLIFLLLLLAGVAIGVYQLQHFQIFKPRAYSALDTLSNNFIETTNKYFSSSEELKKQQLPQLIFLAKQRKAELIKELVKDPGSFFANATLASKWETYPKEVQPFIERNVEVEGQILAGHGDNFKQKTSTPIYSIVSNEGSYFLHFPANVLPNLKTGDRVTVNSVAIGSQLAIPKEGNFRVLSSTSRSLDTSNIDGWDGQNRCGYFKV